jgi:hypothetical protein
VTAATAFTWQGGTTVGTADATGNLAISFPHPFPNGLVTVVLTNSFAEGAAVAGVLDNESVSGFTVRLAASSLTRVNWIAFGW